jgi:hypothetical protein
MFIFLCIIIYRAAGIPERYVSHVAHKVNVVTSACKEKCVAMNNSGMKMH